MNAPQSLTSLGVSREATRPDALAPKRPTEDVKEARELKKTFGQFVGEAFIGQMLKAMRQTVGEPAYFHGGQAERQFQARLDAQLAQDLATSGPDGLVDRLFESSFRDQANLLKQHESSQSLDDLSALRRR